MKLEDVLDSAAKSAKFMKAGRARKADHNIPTVLLSYRGEDLVAMVWPERIDRDLMLKCAKLCSVGFGADVLVLAFETYMATRETDPRTGKRWAPGSMQDAADNSDGRGQGWVLDSIMITAYNRAGDHISRHLPYRVVRKNLIWKDEMTLGIETGYVNDVLTEVMAATTIDVLMETWGMSISDFGLDIEQGRAHQDVAVAKIFLGITPSPGSPRASIVLSMETGTERERIIRAALPGHTTVERSERRA